MFLRSRRQPKFSALVMRNLGLIAILMALEYASVESIWPIFLSNFFFTSASVGFVVAILTFLRFCGLAFLFPLFHKYSARSLLFGALAVNAVAFALFAFTENKYFFFAVAIINVFFLGLRTQAFGILIRNNSSLKEINKNESLMYLISNVGWVIGPLIAGFIADSFSVETVLILASIFLLASTYSITFKKQMLERRKGKDFEHISIFKNFRSFFKDKKRTISYILSGGLEIWWAIPYIFIPLEIMQQGLPIKYV
ncbi:MAG: MFS transporter, partial [Candidatus Methanofastidiosia archaeon]